MGNSREPEIKHISTEKDKPTQKSYLFSGRVHPESQGVWLDPTRIGTNLPSLNWAGEITVAIHFGHLWMIYSGNSVIEDIPSLKNSAQSYAQSLVDSIGYSHGQAFTVQIPSLLTPDGQMIFFADGDLILEETAKDRTLLVPEIIKLMLENFRLRRALNELRKTISEPDDTAFHCQRAVESVRKHFQENQSDKEGWIRLRTALNVSEEALKSLKEFSDPQRHADIPHVTYELRARDMTVAWAVVTRFMQLLHQRVERLPIAEFPII